MTPKWHPLIVRGAFNPALLRLASGSVSGVYAIRRSSTHEVLYVGESSRGVLWKTLLRHFQAPESFRKVRERALFAKSGEGYDVAIEVTSRGPRPRPPAPGSKGSIRLANLKKNKKRYRTDADQKASTLQAEWIANLKPSINEDDGRAFVVGPVNAPEDEDAWGGLLNPGPASPLTELGRLTRLQQTSGPVLRWSLRDAPSLAYDEGGRLFIVYAARPVRSSTPAELREYARSHWGKHGAGLVSNAKIAAGPFVRIGVGKSITYTTKKGLDADPVDYVHPWGEGGPAKGFVPPFVVEHECVGGCSARCASKGALALQGGSYRVTSRGIVG